MDFDDLIARLINRPCSRRVYLMSGMGLIFLKFHLDRLLTFLLFDQAWLPWDYFAPAQSEALRVIALQGGNVEAAQWGFLLFLFATAIPFILIGLILTLRRLGEIGWPRILVGLFFFPAINLIFFAILSILPAREAVDKTTETSGLSAFLVRIYAGTTPFRAGVISVFLSAVPATLLVVFATMVLEDYGWGLFVGIPFILGMMAALLDGFAGPSTAKRAGAVAASALVFVGALCVTFAIEGAICIAMAAPLAIPLAMLGGLTGHLIHRSINRRPDNSVVRACGIGALVVPLMMITETYLPGEPGEVRATTTVEIDAPPKTVWDHVTRFSTLPPTKNFWFTAGIAYPIRARLDGEGVGAIRYCEFSTGAFVEPITEWSPPTLLAFDVASQPPPMHEWSPWSNLEPAHLDGFFKSRRGEFRLIPLDGGSRTRLEGTTWYAHDIWPAPYWRLWSDWMIHSIHERVLDHIRHESERAKTPRETNHVF